MSLPEKSEIRKRRNERRLSGEMYSVRNNHFEAEERTMKPEEQNKTVIQRMIEAIERDGFTAQADFFADQSVNHGMPATRADVRAVLLDISTTFPDVRLEPHDVVAEGDWVAVRCDFTGTHEGLSQHPFVHEGLLAGVAPTGKSVRVQLIHMFRLEGGQVVEH